MTVPPKVTGSSRIDQTVEALSYAFAVFVILVFLKIAWATEDAYIVFRSIEQLFAGHGPRWNPHERVQAFTSPLWFWYLSFFRIFSSNVFVNAMVASALLFLPTLWLLRRLLGHPLKWLLAMMVLVSSIGFFDYTTSGLENPLAYFLIGIYLSCYFGVFDAASERDRKRFLFGMFACAGLMLVCRHDLLTIVLVPAVYAGWRFRWMLSRNEKLACISVALGPLVAWSLFSLIYYGTPLPNTAYAKLGTGVPRLDLATQGLHYWLVCFRRDTITAVVVLAGAGVLLGRRASWQRVLGASVALNITYVIVVGGDFMLGRFLAFAMLVSVVGLLRVVDATSPRGRRILLGAAVACALYMFAYPHTPVNSPLGYRAPGPHPYGVADERGAFARGALWRYVKLRPPVFPDHHWATSGFADHLAGQDYVERLAIGYYGYWAGTDMIIVDPLALTDPLLARLPIDRRVAWRIGHFGRTIPDGYRESILNGTEEIVDPSINAYYAHLKLITQSPLFSRERFKTIIRMNVGAYDHLLAQERARLGRGED